MNIMDKLSVVHEKYVSGWNMSEVIDKKTLDEALRKVVKVYVCYREFSRKYENENVLQWELYKKKCKNLSWYYRKSSQDDIEMLEKCMLTVCGYFIKPQNSCGELIKHLSHVKRIEAIRSAFKAIEEDSYNEFLKGVFTGHFIENAEVERRLNIVFGGLFVKVMTLCDNIESQENVNVFRECFESGDEYFVNASEKLFGASRMRYDKQAV
jgi:hypothetical protein